MCVYMYLFKFLECRSHCVALDGMKLTMQMGVAPKSPDQKCVPRQAAKYLYFNGKILTHRKESGVTDLGTSQGECTGYWILKPPVNKSDRGFLSLTPPCSTIYMFHCVVFH